MNDAESKTDEIAAALRDIATRLREQPANKAIIYHLLSRIVRNNPDIFTRIHSDITSGGHSMQRVSDEMIHAAAALDAKRTAADQSMSEMRSGNIERGPAFSEPGGTPPHDSRLVALQTDGKDMQASLHRLEVGLATVNGRIDSLSERLHAQGQTLTDVKTAIRDIGTTGDSQRVSFSQIFGLCAGLITLFLLLGGAVIAALEHLGTLH